MIWQSHRPSDDRCDYNYNIASNFFIYQNLEFVKKFLLYYQSLNPSKMSTIKQNAKTTDDRILHKHWNHNLHKIKQLNFDELINLCDEIQSNIYDGIHKYGTINVTNYGIIYCYETDGLGNCSIMDDANVPSLLSIPIITNKYNHTIYHNTRNYLLSKKHKYFYESSNVQNNNIRGIGSPHTKYNSIWPLALVTEGLTAHLIENDKLKFEQVQKNTSLATERFINEYDILKVLVENTANTFKMHESFDVNNANSFSRKWFGWANSYFSTFADCFQTYLKYSSNSLHSEQIVTQHFENLLSKFDQQSKQNSNHYRWKCDHNMQPAPPQSSFTKNINVNLSNLNLNVILLELKQFKLSSTTYSNWGRRLRKTGNIMKK